MGGQRHGNTTITSNFGYRTSPSPGYHFGLDIGAPEGSNIIAIFEGAVTYTGFSGAGGYTVTISAENFQASYCHLSSEFLVSVGQYVKQGDIIAKVGPKNVYGVLNNNYHDSQGNPTNGRTTGTHLHLALRKKTETGSFICVDPLPYIIPQVDTLNNKGENFNEN